MPAVKTAGSPTARGFLPQFSAGDHRVSELYNAVPLWLADRLGEYAGFSFLTLWFTGESAERCAAVARAYAGKADPAPPAQYTRGLYYRNVP